MAGARQRVRHQREEHERSFFPGSFRVDRVLFSRPRRSVRAREAKRRVSKTCRLGRRKARVVLGKDRLGLRKVRLGLRKDRLGRREGSLARREGLSPRSADLPSPKEGLRVDWEGLSSSKKGHLSDSEDRSSSTEVLSSDSEALPSSTTVHSSDSEDLSSSKKDRWADSEVLSSSTTVHSSDSEALPSSTTVHSSDSEDLSPISTALSTAEACRSADIAAPLTRTGLLPGHLAASLGAFPRASHRVRRQSRILARHYFRRPVDFLLGRAASGNLALAGGPAQRAHRRRCVETVRMRIGRDCHSNPSNPRCGIRHAPCSL
jgi:hypothetical protein